MKLTKKDFQRALTAWRTRNDATILMKAKLMAELRPWLQQHERRFNEMSQQLEQIRQLQKEAYATPTPKPTATPAPVPASPVPVPGAGVEETLMAMSREEFYQAYQKDPQAMLNSLSTLEVGD